ncbi:MAG: protein kinase, partial [Planctomycetaceae bacterium]|nr:protein kinase [Planctomycetaceae bacterium]
FTALSERDLSGCRAYVRLLSRDLPTFDSIWLDALVQRRLLTPFQADQLSQGQEESLKVGDYFLVDKIQQEPVHVRYLAQHAQTKQQFLIDEYRQPSSIAEETLTQLSLLRNQLEQQAKQISDLVIPVDYIAKNNSLFVVHSHIRGLTARELLIRRGRFPVAMVKTITGQLLKQLAMLESAGIVHGDLRISNLILSRQGTVTLLNAGVIPQLSPHWTLHVPLSYESYDNFAPEMIRDGSWTHQADLYSVGCLLWQLACGRSPVYSADSLLKLRSHVSRSIPDVREYAPDIDPQTAQIIYQLTRKDPHERPGSAQAILTDQKPTRFSGSLIRSYVQNFEHPISKPSRISPRMTMLAAACVLVSLMMWGMGKQMTHLGFNQLLLSITGSQTDSAPLQSKNQQPPAISQWEQAIPLPSPDAQGVMKLVAGQLYQAANLSVVGPLRIESVSTEQNPNEQTGSQTNAIVLVRDQAWVVSAKHLSFNNVTIQHENPAPASAQQAVNNPLPDALLFCKSQTFQADQCQFRTEQQSGQTTRAIAWASLSSTEAISGRLTVSNCQFYSPGSAIILGGPSEFIEINNCLKIGPGDFLEFSQDRSGKQFPMIRCNQLTLRQSDSLLSIDFDYPTNKHPLELTIDATNCVFDLADSSPGLLTFKSTESPVELIRKIDLLGQMLLINSEVNIVGWWNPETQQSTFINPPGTAEGLILIPHEKKLKFQSSDSTQAEYAQLDEKEYQGIRLNSVVPGVNLKQLNANATAMVE